MLKHDDKHNRLTSRCEKNHLNVSHCHRVFTDGALLCVSGAGHKRPYPSYWDQPLGRIMATDVHKARAGLHVWFLTELINLPVLLICSARAPFSPQRLCQAQLRCLKVRLQLNPRARVSVYVRKTDDSKTEN